MTKFSQSNLERSIVDPTFSGLVKAPRVYIQFGFDKGESTLPHKTKELNLERSQYVKKVPL